MIILSQDPMKTLGEKIDISYEAAGSDDDFESADEAERAERGDGPDEKPEKEPKKSTYRVKS
jgi:hypothetical protein